MSTYKLIEQVEREVDGTPVRLRLCRKEGDHEPFYTLCWRTYYEGTKSNRRFYQVNGESWCIPATTARDMLEEAEKRGLLDKDFDDNFARWSDWQVVAKRASRLERPWTWGRCTYTHPQQPLPASIRLLEHLDPSEAHALHSSAALVESFWRVELDSLVFDKADQTTWRDAIGVVGVEPIGNGRKVMLVDALHNRCTFRAWTRDPNYRMGSKPKNTGDEIWRLDRAMQDIPVQFAREFLTYLQGAFQQLERATPEAYVRLPEWLSENDLSPVTLTLQEIETVLGRTLPDSYKKWSAEWHNGYIGQVLRGNGWTLTCSSDLNPKDVTFESAPTKTPESTATQATLELPPKATRPQEPNEVEFRDIIDSYLRRAGWEADSASLTYQNGARPTAGRNQAIANWPIAKGRSDYTLFIGNTPVGLVEAKRLVVSQIQQVDRALLQAHHYSRSYKINRFEDLPDRYGPWGEYQIPFLFAYVGLNHSGVWFLDVRTGMSRSVGKSFARMLKPADIRQALDQNSDAPLQAVQQDFDWPNLPEIELTNAIDTTSDLHTSPQTEDTTNTASNPQFSGHAARHKWPAPLAKLYSKYCGADTKPLQYGFALLLIEGIFRFCAFVLVAEVAARGVKNSEVRGWLRALTSPSMGTLLHISKNARKLLIKGGHSPFVPELMDLLGSDEWAEFATIFPEERNDYAHRKLSISKKKARKKLAELQPLLTQLVRSVQWLENYPFGTFVGMYKMRRAAVPYKGTWKRSRGQLEDGEGIEVTASSEIPNKEVVLMDRNHSRALVLSPLFIRSHDKGAFQYLWLDDVSERHDHNRHPTDDAITKYRHPILVDQVEEQAITADEQEEEEVGFGEYCNKPGDWHRFIALDLSQQSREMLLSTSFPTRFEDKYVERGLLGEGAYSQVFEVLNVPLNQARALKVLRQELTADRIAMDRFVREAQMLVQMNHPGLVTVHQVDTHDGCPFIEMELIDGRNLKEVIAEDGPFMPEQAVELLKQLLDAIAFVHQNNRSHRDLKPSNLMIADGSIKLIDFGIAKDEAMTDLTQTRSSSAIGTLLFMPPGRHKDRWHLADIWGVGLLLAYLLGEGAPQNLHEAPSLAKFEETHPGLVAVYQKATAYDPADRYPSAHAMLNALNAKTHDLSFLRGMDFPLFSRFPELNQFPKHLQSIESMYLWWEAAGFTCVVQGWDASDPHPDVIDARHEVEWMVDVSTDDGLRVLSFTPTGTIVWATPDDCRGHGIADHKLNQYIHQLNEILDLQGWEKDDSYGIHVDFADKKPVILWTILVYLLDLANPWNWDDDAWNQSLLPNEPLVEQLSRWLIDQSYIETDVQALTPIDRFAAKWAHASVLGVMADGTNLFLVYGRDSDFEPTDITHTLNPTDMSIGFRTDLIGFPPLKENKVEDDGVGLDEINWHFIVSHQAECVPLSRSQTEQLVHAKQVYSTPESMRAFAFKLLDGEDMPADPTLALAILNRQIAQGDQDTKLDLSFRYDEGIGVEQNVELARRWQREFEELKRTQQIRDIGSAQRGIEFRRAEQIRGSAQLDPADITTWHRDLLMERPNKNKLKE